MNTKFLGEEANSNDFTLLSVYLSELFIQYVQNPRDKNIIQLLNQITQIIKRQQGDTFPRSNILRDYHFHIKDKEPFDYKQYRAPELVWLCVVLSFSQ